MKKRKYATERERRQTSALRRPKYIIINSLHWPEERKTDQNHAVQRGVLRFVSKLSCLFFTVLLGRFSPFPSRLFSLGVQIMSPPYVPFTYLTRVIPHQSQGFIFNLMRVVLLFSSCICIFLISIFLLHLKYHGRKQE